MLQRLEESLLASPIVKKGDYNYFIHPITDGVPSISPALIREVACAMIRIMDLSRADYIVAAEAMGIPIGIALSLMTDIPLSIVRKREYGLPGEVSVSQVTGYSKNQLFINGIKRGDRIVIVDDVISTGGTTKALLSAFESIGAIVQDICFVISKGDVLLDHPYRYLVRIDVTDQVKICDTTL
ncbi:MAG: purine phosphoribosyltransferase family protein [Methanospirillaceae archaeon]|nr:purine phosphoribosyltransferase family protein [Methanospirillaceae archaeon]